MKQVREVFGMNLGESKQIGSAELSCYELKLKNTELFMMNWRFVRNNGTDLFNLENGIYITLKIDGELFMSDTPMELKSNQEIIEKANGRVLIGGLGIGLLLHNLMDKLESGEVTEIVVAENNKDVINLIGPYYKHPKIKIWNKNIYELIEDKDVMKEEKFDTIYLDIWSEISEDEYEEMKKLQRSFRKFLNKENPNKYINCWMKDFLQKQKRRNLL